MLSHFQNYLDNLGFVCACFGVQCLPLKFCCHNNSQKSVLLFFVQCLFYPAAVI